ncbi:MAG: response regulator [Treponema sp.]|jgi:CheY-like chemotaxis protein|nr:response regulator [Treponema sp.]
MENKKTILAVDDEAMELLVLEKCLVPRFDFLIAKSAAEATSRLENNKVDLVLLDIEMSGISGFEFLHTIRKNPKHMSTPVIIVTGHDEAGFEERSKSAGADAFIIKPVDADDLIAKIDKALEQPRRNPFGL